MITTKEELKRKWQENWPETIARSEVEKYTGGLFSRKTLANEDCLGTGPKKPIKLQRGRIGYTKEHLIDWILSKILLEDNK